MTKDFSRESEGDAVLREVRRIKETLGAEYGHDIEKLFEITAAHERRSTHPVATLRVKSGKAK